VESRWFDHLLACALRVVSGRFVALSARRATKRVTDYRVPFHVCNIACLRVTSVTLSRLQPQNTITDATAAQPIENEPYRFSAVKVPRRSAIENVPFNRVPASLTVPVYVTVCFFASGLSAISKRHSTWSSRTVPTTGTSAGPFVGRHSPRQCLVLLLQVADKISLPLYAFRDTCLIGRTRLSQFPIRRNSIASLAAFVHDNTR
jgi:hypothetical protein